MITYEEDVDNENNNISTHSEPSYVLNIKSNLIKPQEKLKIGNRLLEDSNKLINLAEFISIYIFSLFIYVIFQFNVFSFLLKHLFVY